MAEPLLSVERVSRRFGGLLAVDAASLSAPAGRITALDRPQRRRQDHALCRHLRIPTSRAPGVSAMAARTSTGEPAHRLRAARHRPDLPDRAALSAASRCATTFWSARICAIAARADAVGVAETVGREVGLGDLLDRPAHTLTVAGRKRLELARALATEPQLLLLDEVLAGLNPAEIRDIVPVIRALCARGIAMIMIEHVMQAVMSLSEHVFVLAEGRIIADGSPAQVVARCGCRRGLSRPSAPRRGSGNAMPS